MNKTEIYYKCLKCNQIKSVDEFPKDKKAKMDLDLQHVVINVLWTA
jgi:hypothetical protein